MFFSPLHNLYHILGHNLLKQFTVLDLNLNKLLLKLNCHLRNILLPQKLLGILKNTNGLYKKCVWCVCTVPVMGNVKGPPPLSSLLTHIHTAVASESPSFPQIVHLATPRKKENTSGTATKRCTNKTVYKTLRLGNRNYTSIVYSKINATCSILNTLKQMHAASKPYIQNNSFTSTRLEMRTRFLSGTISPSKEHMATMCWHCSSNTTLWMPA